MIADQLTDLFDDRACDGFVLTPTTFPGMFEQFSRAVVPLLAESAVCSGLEYAGRTLRENLRA